MAFTILLSKHEHHARHVTTLSDEQLTKLKIGQSTLSSVSLLIHSS